MGDEAFWKNYTLEKHNKLLYSRLEYLLFVAAGIGVSVALFVLGGEKQLLILFLTFCW